ncbi:hypothetical protein COB11_00900 [Candidatus Aerophobetes bacterium]|uniref:O-succinylbenzoate synthase n=1 Tax=Aerophobetes bacterium TaxID=2030807 RepID=A0A2A4YMJ1_UNCAE|nr:MAG: hypothetical protein COB11_00900 [Candidatus Aerophobetes bacterium]
MIFKKVQLYRYACPLKSPLALKSGPLRTRSGILIKAIDAQNRAYFAESAPLPGFSQESLQMALNELREAGKRLLHPPTLLPELLPSNQFAMHCLNERFDSSFSDVEICKYVHGTFDEMLSEIKTYKDASYIKIKLGGFSAKESVEFFKRACNVVSNNCRFRIDFNQMFDLSELDKFCKMVDFEKIDYIEEPTLNPFDLTKIEYPAKFALDESIRKYPLEKLLQIPNIKALVIKPMLDMPRLRDKRFLNAAHKEKLELIFSPTYESQVGLAHITKLAKKHSPERVHGLDTGKLFGETPIINDTILNPKITELIYESDTRSIQTCT